MSAASGISFTSDLANIDDAFSEDLRINFYRIVQECLNNVAKHARATEGSITIRRAAERVTLVIRDNGRGFTPGSSSDGPGGFGLIGIAERARLLAGELAIQSAQGRGTTVNVEFHLRK
jgi:signal transduction histidine kinase